MPYTCLRYVKQSQAPMPLSADVSDAQLHNTWRTLTKSQTHDAHAAGILDVQLEGPKTSANFVKSNIDSCQHFEERLEFACIPET